MKTNRNSGWDAAIGSADLKTVVAVLFAVGGLSWGAVSILSGRDKPSDDKPRVIASALDDEGNAVEPQYSKASSDRQIDRVQEELEAAVDLQAQAALRSIAVPKGLSAGVSDAVVNAFIPILSGNHDSFLDAIVAMGGEVPGELDGEHPMFKQLAKVFEGARVDLSRISVSKYEAPAGRGMGMRRDVVTDDQDIEPGQDGMPAVQTSVMEMRPASLFPDAPSKNDPTALEVKVPVQPKGDENESIFSLILTWNPDAKHWQPAAYRTIRNRLMEED